MKKIFSVAALALVAAPAVAFAQTSDFDNIAINARVLQPINVVGVAALNFGDVFRGQGPKTIDAKATSQTPMFPTAVAGARGEFTIESSRDQGVEIQFTLTNPEHTTSAGEILSVTAPKFCVVEAAGTCATDSNLAIAYAAAPAFSAGDNTIAATRYVYVGGTVEAVALTKLGTYLGSLRLDARYTGL